MPSLDLDSKSVFENLITKAPKHEGTNSFLLVPLRFCVLVVKSYTFRSYELKSGGT